MNLGLDPKDTGQSCKGVKHRSARVRYVCVCVHCEQQSAHRRAFPLDKEMWTCRLCCRAGWWAAAGGLPRRSARSWKGGLVCPGAEWLELEFSSPSAWFQFYFPQLSAAFPVPHCPGCRPSACTHCVQAHLQMASGGSPAQGGPARPQKGALASFVLSVGAASVHEAI